MSYKERLTRLFSQYSPGDLNAVDTVLSAYAGREEAMLKGLVKKFGPEPPVPEPEATASSDYKDQLTRFYQRYAPHKLPDVERNLSRYVGNEKKMFEILHKKYGVEPETSVANNVVSEVSNRNNSMSHKERLTRFYQQYDPHNLGNVDATLRAYAGREEAMFKELVEKYGEPSTPTTVASDYKDQLTRFYQRYAPHKLPDVERNLSRFAGNEKEMFEILHKKYGVEPETSVANNVVSEVPRSNPETRGVFLIG